MAIIRVTVRTFQNLEHAELFLSIGASTKDGLSKAGLEAKFTISQSISQLNQVVSVWEYKDEDHMNEVRKFLSAQSRLPNSLAPKEIAYETKVIHSS
tara:strand:+ start:1169 stop:1459 length:291 start_codon:yes stop_codon:yes gene_type:complete